MNFNPKLLNRSFANVVLAAVVINLKIHIKMKEILIHFTDVDVCFESLKENNIIIDEFTMEFIKNIHSVVDRTNDFLPATLQQDVCFRASNFILKHIEIKYKVELKKYTRSNWALS